MNVTEERLTNANCENIVGLAILKKDVNRTVTFIYFKHNVRMCGIKV
jgi:hypothetical protein